MTKRLAPELKNQRKPTRVACSFCHSKHLQCDDTRPCKNCVKRGHADTCRDVERRRKKSKKNTNTKVKPELSKGSVDKNVSNGTDHSDKPLNQPKGDGLTSEMAYSVVQNNQTQDTDLKYTNINKPTARSDVAAFNAGFGVTSSGAHHDSTRDNNSVPATSSDSGKNAPDVADTAEPEPSVKRKRGRPRKTRTESEVVSKKSRAAKGKTKVTDKLTGGVDEDSGENGVMLDNNVKVGLGLVGVNNNANMSSGQLPNQIQSNTSHLPLLNLANVSLSNMNLDSLAPPPGFSMKSSSSLSGLQLPSFTDLKAPLFHGITDMKSPRFDFKPFGMSPLTKEAKLVNIDSNFNLPNLNNIEKPALTTPSIILSEQEATENSQPIPGSPLEFSVTGSSRANTLKNIGSQDMHSSASGSLSNFESNVANDEYTKLKSMLSANQIIPNPTTPSFMHNVIGSNFRNTPTATPGDPDVAENNDFYNFEGINDLHNLGVIDDDDEDIRPFILINLDDGTMISSYKDNTTPNSYVYNADHSKMKNTANEVPKDFEQSNDYTSPLIMRHVIKHPDDIYLTNIVKAYRYPKAYHALIAYLKQRFNKLQLLEIAKCMAKYRPSFISATKNLFENDLIFTERSFQRTLLEYENMIAMSPSPTIIWRRTGEIVALTNEFAVMTGYSKMSLLTKRTFIVELMDDESTINYFRSFSEFAFGDLNATHLTDCNIRKAEENNYLRCCCVWTIKRDVFDIPMLIVGQFLPVLE